jgi:prepilin-type processing-associated H-X9-DG protein
MGLGMVMYVSDNRRYPPLWDTSLDELCFDKLRPYYPLCWTNLSWNCPTYVARGGVVYAHSNGDHALGYCYNWKGTAQGWPGCPRSIYQFNLGLGHLSKDSAAEPEVRVPSEMYIAADVRPFVEGNGIVGNPKMMIWGGIVPKEADPPHGKGYNVVFGDGHVALVKRRNYLFPPRTARNWNRDNQPHPESWAPPACWAVQQ